MKHLSVALDGPSGTGKSTTAKLIAKHLGIQYVDTGAMYRTVGLFTERNGVNPEDENAVSALLSKLKISVKYTQQVQKMFIGDEEVTALIRSETISAYASKVAKHAAVRAFLLDLQREVAQQNDVIMDGRDIGTVILPNADVKIFLSAPCEVRAMRRCEELKEKGENAVYEEVLADMKARDARDANRDTSPCVPAEDAIRLDNSSMTLDQTADYIEKIIKNRNSADIGLIGLAVMGENLVLNMERNGFTVAVYNRTTSKVDAFIEGRGKDKKFVPCHSIGELCSSLKSPKKVMLMIKAGDAVDGMIEQIIPYLNKGDIIIDGGNSHFPDTIRRTAYVESRGLYYIGTGVSGGEEGALKGPSMMPGGSPQAWETVKPIFHSICAKVEDGTPCCDWVGQGGAGHFVKMVHNGIEYGDMQLICEAYQLMRDYIGMSADEMHEVFENWRHTELDSYLIDITTDILAKKDADGTPLVDKILDTAGQKGTGKWTAISALDEGIPLTLIGEAVFARCLSALKEKRVAASAVLGEGYTQFTGTSDEKKQLIEDIRKSLLASKIISYAQGFTLMQAAAKDYGWTLNYGSIALMWRGGCIIRSTFLGKIKEAYDKNPLLDNLLLDDYFSSLIKSLVPSWRKAVAASVMSGVPAPAFCSALSYYDGFRSPRLSANLLQAQRDYFGAHTYERTDAPRGQFFHTEWLG